MKKATLIILIAFIVSSCGQARKQQAEIAIISEVEQNISVTPSIKFDWGKVIALKNSTIEELKKKEKSEDKIIMNFLNKYSKLADDFSDILFNNENYDHFNTLILDYYSGDKNATPPALEFKNEIETNGFNLEQSEGMIYIAQNTDFIKSEILSLVDAISKEFINLYCNELDNRCCEDAGIIISTEELVNRVYKWGELSKKVSRLEYKNHVEDEFYSNLSLLFFGIDNTPAFDWETKKYNSKAIDLMNKMIEKNPTSRATEKFKPFIELLESEDFEKTEKIKNYWESEK